MKKHKDAEALNSASSTKVEQNAQKDSYWISWSIVWSDRNGVGKLIAVPKFSGPRNSWLSRVGKRLQRSGKINAALL